MMAGPPDIPWFAIPSRKPNIDPLIIGLTGHDGLRMSGTGGES
jgi:hypothetical protein